LTPTKTNDKINITDQLYWDEYWNNLYLPAEVKNDKNNLYLTQILKVFNDYLPKDKGLSILEIGGAPGQYLAYMHNTFGYKITCLDYSKVGCEKTIENFKLLGIDGNVFQGDLFSGNLTLPLFDIVYSLGFIEHFNDLSEVIINHLKLLKPGGILLVGTPNFTGIYKIFLKHLAPKLLSRHILSTMDISNWKSFEKESKLEILFKSYIGGFELSILNRSENRTIINAVLLRILIVIRMSLKAIKNYKKYNNKFISGYIIGVYRKP
jgi:2-polyprenyl-3-methyl-5-hydroxy-6-metoxy-1,4-benzoquinol methylase